MMKTCCALVLVLLGVVVAASAQSDNPDPNPTKCCPMLKSKNCNFTTYVDENFKRTASSTGTPKVTTSMEECFQLCKHVVKGCKAVNFRKTDKLCEFMDTLYEGDADGFEDDLELANQISKEDAEYHSAIVNPSCDDLCKKRTMIWGYHRVKTNDDKIEEGVASVAECCKHCLADEECLAYDYNWHSKNCFLKKNIPELVKHIERHVVTGLSCPFAGMDCTCN